MNFKTEESKTFENFFPCQDCIKKNTHCHKGVPLFTNEEAATLIDSETFNKIQKKEPLMVVRYAVNSELWVFIPKKFKGKEYKAVKKFEKENKDCVFFKNGKCQIEEYKPIYCKKITEVDNPLTCPYINMDIKDKTVKELNQMKQDKTKIKEMATFFTQIYGDNIIRRKIVTPKVTKKNIKITKDELIFTVIYHSLIQYSEAENSLISKKEKKELHVDNTGEVIVYSNTTFHSEEKELKNFLTRVNQILQLTFHVYNTVKIGTLINKTQSFLNGIAKNMVVSDVELKEKHQGLLLAITLLYMYKTEWKSKDRRFRGLFKDKDLQNVGEFVLDQIEEGGDDAEAVFEKVGKFARAYFNTVQKNQI